MDSEDPGPPEEKKKMYEEVLKRQLDALNSDYAMLQMQSEELRVRNLKGQTKLCALMQNFDTRMQIHPGIFL